MHCNFTILNVKITIQRLKPSVYFNPVHLFMCYMCFQDVNYQMKNVWMVFIIGLCDNGKTCISIMHGKIILIMMVISINDNKSVVHVNWIFATYSKIALYSYNHTSHLHVLYNAQQYPGIYYYFDNKIYYLNHDNRFIS